jgi:hypothetical protein
MTVYARTSDMIKSEVDQKVIEELKRRRVNAEFESRMRLIDEMGADTYANGDILRFQKQYKPEGMRYTYAAVKANDVWYITGVTVVPGKTSGMTWEEFLNVLFVGIPATDIIKMEPADVVIAEIRENTGVPVDYAASAE